MRNIFLILLSAAVSIMAQSFTVEVSSSKVGIDEQFQVSFKFSGSNINSLKDFNPPDFNNFILLSGPNVSTSMQIINGVVSAFKSYNYYLRGRDLGKFTIGRATVKSEGRNYNTDPVTIEIIKGTPKPSNNNVVPNASNDEIKDNLFIRAVADKQKVYQGEQVTITYKLYTRLNIASQMSVSKLPSYQGFWAEEIETSGNISFSTEVYEGVQYKVGILKKAALFPTQTGELSVSPFELMVPVQVQKKRRSNNPFDDFFNDPFFGAGETVEYKAKSNTIKIESLPLPSEGRPESFKGAVGDYTLKSSADKLQTKTNEPVSLKLSVSGSGNIRLLETPEVNLPSGFDKYEPKVSEEINRRASISGTKYIEYLLIPRTAGKKVIPQIEFSFFNPSKREYVTLKTEPYTIEIEHGQQAYSQDFSKEDIRLLGDDIRFIKTSADLERRSEILIYRPGFWVSSALPLIALIGLVMWKRKQDSLLENPGRYKNLKAQKVARSRLKLAAQLMQQGKPEQFYTEISQAINGYIGDKLSIPNSEYSIEIAENKLSVSGADAQLIDKLKILLQRCEFIRFAPDQKSAAGMNHMYDEVNDLIVNLEKVLSRGRND